MGASALMAWKIGVLGDGDDHGEKICVKVGWAETDCGMGKTCSFLCHEDRAEKRDEKGCLCVCRKVHET